MQGSAPRSPAMIRAMPIAIEAIAAARPRRADLRPASSLSARSAACSRRRRRAGRSRRRRRRRTSSGPRPAPRSRPCGRRQIRVSRACPQTIRRGRRQALQRLAPCRSAGEGSCRSASWSSGRARASVAGEPGRLAGREQAAPHARRSSSRGARPARRPTPRRRGRPRVRGTSTHRLELVGDRGVGPERGRASVPRPPVGVARWQRVGDQPVQPAALGGRSRGVDGGPDQRVGEVATRSGAELSSPGCSARSRRRRSRPWHRTGAGHDGEVPVGDGDRRACTVRSPGSSVAGPALEGRRPPPRGTSTGASRCQAGQQRRGRGASSRSASGLPSRQLDDPVRCVHGRAEPAAPPRPAPPPSAGGRPATAS